MAGKSVPELFCSTSKGMPPMPLLGGDGHRILCFMSIWISIAIITEGDGKNVAWKGLRYPID
ncbi:MAG: hypothetical protein WC375_05105 [Methanomassiliicoccales archaeon]